jgi:adenine-specific DNA-methyltransferase
MKCVKYICKNTEELGILVEKAMCNIMNIAFNTKRKYDSLPKDVYDDINSTVGQELKRMKMNHTGNMNMKYDFVDDDGKTMSVKTIMSGNKICPQSIGQCSFRSFNNKTGLNFESKNDFKRYFMDNKNEMLKKYLYNCICCDKTIVYKFQSGFIYIIDKCGEVDFTSNLNFSTSKTMEDWNESNTIYVNYGNKRLSLGEIQIHNNRDCIKFRFNIDTLVDMISNNYISAVNLDIYSLKTKYYFKVANKEDLMPRNKLCFPSFNYIGSKMKLLDFIRKTIENYIGKGYSEISGFADICSGTGVVAFDVLKENCKKILTNDIQHYAYTVSSVWSTKNIDIVKIKNMILEINSMIKDIDIPKYDKTSPYFIYNNYTEAGPDGRMYLSMKNGYRVDIVRSEIMRLQAESLVNLDEHNLLLKLLLYAVAGVSNIASVYGAYLKKYKACALKDLVLDADLIGNLVQADDVDHVAKNMNVTDLLLSDDLSGYEVVYIDPPYVANRGYHDNYHLLETISRYDYPSIKGKTGLRESGIKSKFCSKREAELEFKNVLEKIKSEYVFISYSSESVVSKDLMMSTMRDAGWKDVICCEKEYQRFKSNRNSEDLQGKNIIEYVFCGKRK